MKTRYAWFLVFLLGLGALCAQTSGGPDAFGYTWANNDDPNGPDFNWIDITNFDTPLTLADDGYQTVSLPWSFPFYGQEYTSITICSNGYVTFGSTGDAYENAGIPATAEPNAIIAMFWDDFNPTAGGTISYAYNSGPNEFYVLYNAVEHYSTSGSVGTYTMELILSSDGQVSIQYQTMVGLLNSATIGIENTDGAVGLEILHNATPTGLDGRAIHFNYPPSADYDLRALGLISPCFAVVGEEASGTLSLKNPGANTISDYTVRLVDQDRRILGSSGGDPIEPGQLTAVSVSWTPSDMLSTRIHAEIICEEDMIPDDNSTDESDIRVQAAGTVVYGQEAISPSYHVPFSLYYRSSLTQTVYPGWALSLAGIQNSIHRIAYHSITGQAATDIPVRVWMGTPAQSDLGPGWAAINELTEVFNGLVSVPAGDGLVSIDLPVPFSYTGGNLVIMVLRTYQETTLSASNGFYTTTGDEFATRYIESDGEGIDPATMGPGTLTEFIPATLLYSHDEAGSLHLTGNVRNSLGEGLSAHVSIDGIGSVDATAEGAFDFGYLPFGNYTLSVSADHYLPRPDIAINVSAGMEPLDIVMDWNLSLAVVLTLNTDGSAAGALVTATSADTTYTQTADTYGSVLFQDMVPGDYSLDVTLASFHPVHYGPVSMVEFANQQRFITLTEWVMAPTSLAYAGGGWLSWTPGSRESRVSSRETAREIVGYQVLLDGALLGTTTETGYQLPTLDEGSEHIAGVAAEYMTGISDTVYVTFTATGTDDHSAVPRKTAWNGAFPNPFNPSTTFSFDVAAGETATVMIFDIRGRLIRNLGTYHAGGHKVVWDGRNDAGIMATSGVYITRMMSGGKAFVQKTMMLK
jgi:hypothetical protein